MSETDQKFIKHWGEERAKGKVRFIVIYIIMIFTGLNIFNLIINYFYLDSGNFVDLIDPQQVPRFLAISSGLGLYKWYSNEKRYNKLTHLS